MSPKGEGGEGRELSAPSTSLCPPGFIVLGSLFSKALAGVRLAWGLPTWLAVGTRRGPPGPRSAGAVLLVPHPFFLSQFGLPSLGGVRLMEDAEVSCSLVPEWKRGGWGGPLGTQDGGSFRWSPTGERSKEIQSSGKRIEKASVAGAIISLHGGGSRKMEWERVLMLCALQ